MNYQPGLSCSFNVNQPDEDLAKELSTHLTPLLILALKGCRNDKRYEAIILNQACLDNPFNDYATISIREQKR